MTPNVVRYVGEFALIELNRNLIAIIDASDYPLVSGYRWTAGWSTSGRCWYVMSSSGGRTVYLHRVIMGAGRGQQVDHRFHDTLDNRRQNLRIVTNQENNQNRNGAYRTSKTGIRGVSVHRCRPSGLLYVARVHRPKPLKDLTRYFPYTAEGLHQAAEAVVEMRRESMPFAKEA